MTKQTNHSSSNSPSDKGAKGRSGQKRKGRLPGFEWGEVDDVQQAEDVFLPVKKKKKRSKKFEKIESTLTVGGVEEDPYEIKVTPERPVSSTPEDDDLAIPSYGKMLEEGEEDEFSIFLRNAEKAEEREKNRANARKERRTKKDVPTDKKKGDIKERADSSRSKNSQTGKKSKGEKSPAPSRDGESESPELKGKDSKGKRTVREPDRKPRSSEKTPSRPDRSSNDLSTEGENPFPAVMEQLAKIRQYGLARMRKIGFSRMETDRFLSSLSGVEKVIGFIDLFLHSSLIDQVAGGPSVTESPEKTGKEPELDAKTKAALFSSEETFRKKGEERSEREERSPEMTGKFSGGPDEKSAETPSTSKKTKERKKDRPTPKPEEPETTPPTTPPEGKKVGKTSLTFAPGRDFRPSPSKRSEPIIHEPFDPAPEAVDEDRVDSPESNKAIRDAWTFDGVPLSDPMIAMIAQANYETPTPIQSGTIPRILAGRDVLGQSRTGSGKTAAFMIPIIERIETCEPGDDPVALIIVPTRELAVQIRDETVKLSKNREIVTVACYGGKPIADQIKKMRGGVDIVIGTPGRIIDLTKRSALSLSRLKWVVLDEADRMLDIGFRPDIERILKMTPKERQTLLFSATLAEPVVRLAQRYMIDPETYDFSESDIASETIEQFYITVDRERKFEALIRLLRREDPHQAIVFCRTKRGVDKLGRGLVREFKEWKVAAIHGDLTQPQRDNIMRSFRAGAIKILVATDVVGRGIDVTGISHIINYDIPQFCDDYVHRVGRTGRMGREGVAYTLVTSQEGAELTRIEMRINRLLKRSELEGFEAFTRPDESEEEPKEHKAVYGKPVRRVRRAL